MPREEIKAEYERSVGGDRDRERETRGKKRIEA